MNGCEPLGTAYGVVGLVALSWAGGGVITHHKGGSSLSTKGTGHVFLCSLLVAQTAPPSGGKCNCKMCVKGSHDFFGNLTLKY